MEARGHGVQSRVLMWTWEDLGSNLNFWLCDLDTFNLPFEICEMEESPGYGRDQRDNL